ncbi:MAG: response regulator [Flavobacteriales bacterium]|nr:response regulator [Flavobacteriales bacterium]
MKKILIVDDEEMVLVALKDFLENKGYQVITSNQSRGVISTISKEKPDLIIMDFAMPDLSGLDILDTLRNDYSNSTPFILISSFGAREITSNAYQLGADFIEKPIDLDKLSKRVDRLLFVGTAMAS